MLFFFFGVDHPCTSLEVRWTEATKARGAGKVSGGVLEPGP